VSIMSFSKQADTIRVGEPLANFDRLEQQKFEYNVFSQRGDKRSPSIKMSSEIKKVKIDNKDYLAITHTWSSAMTNGSFCAIVEPQTLKPVVHIRNTPKGKQAYKFSHNAVTTLDSAKNNIEKDFSINLPEPTFNFEIDLETFSVLPLAKGKEFAVNFYHAGGSSAPSWYTIKVERSERLDVEGLGNVDTWVLFMDYHGVQPTRFWYTKESHEFIKMEGEFNGTKIYKQRLF